MPPPIRAAADHNVAYRPMEEADLGFVAEVYASTRREELAQAALPPDAAEAFLAQQHRAQHDHYSRHYPGMEWLIVEVAGSPAGRLYLCDWAGEMRIVDIALLPDFRGSGIGGAILRDILDLATTREKPVTIHVEKFNSARNLYLRLGFSPIEDKGVYDLLRWEPPASEGN